MFKTEEREPSLQQSLNERMAHLAFRLGIGSKTVLMDGAGIVALLEAIVDHLEDDSKPS